MPRNARWTAAFLCAVWLAVVAVPPAAGAEVDKAALDTAFAALQAYDWGHDRAQLAVIDDAIVHSHGDPRARKAIETRLVAVLESDAKRAAKQFVCRKLSVIGSEDTVKALAAYLTDEELSHMARYALERMPYPSADKALRDALPKASGQVKVGIINSLGEKGDDQATELLTPLLKDSDPQVAAAAAAALGKIATPRAAIALTGYRKDAPAELRQIVTDACLDVAERLVAADQKEAAARIYEMLDAPSEPPRVRLAAFQGLVAARPAEATPRLLRALAGDDPQMRGLAARLIRETPGEEATRAFADAFDRLPTTSQVVLLDALGARGDAAARPAVTAGLKSDNAEVRTAAIRAMATVGGAEDVPMLARTAAQDGPASDAARDSLAEMKGPGVDAAIVREMRGADSNVQVVLLGALAARDAGDAADTVLAATRSDDEAVRAAAVDAMAVLAEAEHADDLIRLLKAAANDAERDRAEKALLALCTRAGEACADALVAGMQGADPAAKVRLLRALGRVGGRKALTVVQQATRDADADVQIEAVRVLAGWSDASAAQHLLALAESSRDRRHQILALRGYVRLVDEQRAPDDVKLRALEKAMGLANDPGVKKQVLSALGDVRTPDSLRLVVPHIGDPALNEEACSAATEIAEKIWQDNRDLVRDAMTQVVKHTKNNRTKGSASKVLGQVAPKSS